LPGNFPHKQTLPATGYGIFKGDSSRESLAQTFVMRGSRKRDKMTKNVRWNVRCNFFVLRVKRATGEMKITLKARFVKFRNI
jgi:hypothetical protein